MNINNIIDSTRVLDTETIATDTELALKETITNVALKAPIASPTFTGTATAPTVTATTSFVGKNACTAWVNFNGTTTPPTIRDSFNVSDVVRTSTGVFEIYFQTNMDNTNYSISSSTVGSTEGSWWTFIAGNRTLNITSRFRITVVHISGANINMGNTTIQIFGGLN